MAKELYREGGWEDAAEIYRDKLQKDPEFIHTLLELFRIGGALEQSYFFRNVKNLGVLFDTIIPSFSPDRKVHITSIGTSKGMDLLSLLMKGWDARDRLELSGVDVNPISLQAAIDGRYKTFYEYDRQYRKNPAFRLLKKPLLDIASNVPKRVRDAVFHTEKTPNGKELVVTDEARSRLHFDEWDILLQGPLPDKQEVVLLENVGMYFSPKGRKKVFENIYDSLTPDGWLICEPMAPDGRFPEYDKWAEDLSWLGFERIDQRGRLLSGKKIYRVIPGFTGPEPKN
jgi:chemotaxis methyl-accepting protein methylase